MVHSMDLVLLRQVEMIVQTSESDTRPTWFTGADSVPEVAAEAEISIRMNVFFQRKARERRRKQIRLMTL